MQVDYLIVGQGICGTMLSWMLRKQQLSFVVIDEQRKNAASMVSAGIINPVTGRRYAYTWMIDEVMPFAIGKYRELEKDLNIDLVTDTSIIDFFPSPQMRSAFLERLEEDSRYLHSFPDQNNFNTSLNYEFGCGEIKPVYSIDIRLLLERWRTELTGTQRLLEEAFVHQELVIEKGFVKYKDIEASKIIFCDGVESAGSPWFDLLPFAPNKGEALIIECKELSRKHIFKKGLLLTPYGSENLFWVGSNYQWEFDNDEPSKTFYDQTERLLKAWLKPEFKVVEHLAAVRPATIERRPFVGLHPQHPELGLLNGMGTKGASLAPFFASNFVQHLVDETAIQPEADIKRFSRILSR